MRFAGSASGGTGEIVTPLLPSFMLICDTRACTSGGCVSPAMITPAPRLALRSRTTASTQSLLSTSPVGRVPIPRFDAMI